MQSGEIRELQKKTVLQFREMERAASENEYRLNFKRRQTLELTSQAENRRQSLEEFRVQQLKI